MSSLRKFLLDKGYTRVPLKRISTDHYEVYAKVNGVEGRFILDTGASNTCIGTDRIDHFNLQPKDSEIRAAGAGGRGMSTQIAKRNSVEIGEWKRQKLAIILFNMMYVNAALAERDAIPVDGIIGADVLKRAKAVIDYDKNCVYLR